MWAWFHVGCHPRPAGPWSALRIRVFVGPQLACAVAVATTREGGRGIKQASPRVLFPHHSLTISFVPFSFFSLSLSFASFCSERRVCCSERGGGGAKRVRRLRPRQPGAPRAFLGCHETHASRELAPSGLHRLLSGGGRKDWYGRIDRLGWRGWRRVVAGGPIL